MNNVSYLFNVTHWEAHGASVAENHDFQSQFLRVEPVNPAVLQSNPEHNSLTVVLNIINNPKQYFSVNYQLFSAVEMA